MSFENAAVPRSLFTEEGVMYQSAKCIFMQKLEELLPDHLQNLQAVTGIDAMIYDGHAEIRALSVDGLQTFEETAARFLDRLKKECKQVHIVFDKYLENSIKTGTREKRGQLSSVAPAYHIQPKGEIPTNWSDVLLCGANKMNLADLYADYASCHIDPSVESIFVSGGSSNIIKEVDRNGASTICEEDHEEADTRLVLHAKLAATKGAKRIVIKSPDTDVLMLLLHHRRKIHAREIYLCTGRIGANSDMRRYIPVHHLYRLIPRDVRAILLEVYCLTGCDTTSSFYFHGKTKAFTIMNENAAKHKHLQDLGTSPIGNSVASVKFVAQLYGSHNCDSLNEVREKKAASKKPIPMSRMPPTNNSFDLHVKRCNLQLLIWKKACVAKQLVPDALDHGYERVDGRMMPVMMTQEPAAPELLNDIICTCADMCESNCKCKLLNQPCTAACYCDGLEDHECNNPVTIVVSLENE